MELFEGCNAVPWRTATVTLRGRHLATYWVGWHPNDPASTVEVITARSLQNACDEGLLHEEDVDVAEVAVSAEQFEALPDEVAQRVEAAWKRAPNVPF